MTLQTAERRLSALPPPPASEVCRALGIDRITIQWLAGDGSDRCYYRLASSQLQRPLVLMQLSGSDAEALRVNGYDWVTVGEVLTQNKVAVPKLIKQMPEYAALIIEDYGDTMLESRVIELCRHNKAQELRTLYKRSTELIARMLKIEGDESSVWRKRGFDHQRYVWELNFFRKNFLEPVTRLNLSATETQRFANECDRLATELAKQARFFVHRDFHSRNIMLRDQDLAIIDFQDARLGPPSYDLVSLIFDSYVPFSHELRMEILQDAFGVFRSQLPGPVAELVEANWKAMLLQRQIKAIGSFGYLTLVKNRGDYLRYVNPALATLRNCRVSDDRWPMLSGELLERMAENLAAHD